MEVVTENYQLKWHSFTTHLHTSIANFFDNDSMADVVLFTMDGHQILAHRFVLSTCSQYFHKVLKFQYKLTTTLPIAIVLPPEINYKTLKVLTQYMYTGETTVSKDILESVLRGGDLLKIQGLWRPREETYQDKKLVKVHQKLEQAQQHHVKTSEASDGKTEDTRDEKKPEHKSSVVKCTSKDPLPLVINEKTVTPAPSDTIKSSVYQKDHKTQDVTSDNLQQYLVIKEEPLEWTEVNDSEMVLVEENMFSAEMTIKPEVVIEDQPNDQAEDMYSPLTCELCSETFRLPADWVRHIQSHTDMMPAKRQRRGRSSSDDDSRSFPPLHCDMCQKYFPTPAEWVHHIQNTHTEFELRLSNKSVPVRSTKASKQQLWPSQKICTLCDKKFPSHASMLIHKRTHTGEKPYMCEYCYKGFNVKSNLLRHLRTLHDKIINSTEIELKGDGSGEDVPENSEKASQSS